MSAQPSSRRPPGRPKDEALAARRRGEILDQAVRHFARSGYANADLDAVAADVGCAKGTLYRYFPSKEALFHAAVDSVMQGLLAATSSSASRDPLGQLEDAVRAYLKYFDAHPEYVELLIQERAEFRDRKKPTYFEHRDANRGRWKRRLRELMDDGRIRRMPPERALDVIGNLLYGTIFTNYFAGRRGSHEGQVADILTVLFHGLRLPEKAAGSGARAGRRGR
jgi:AcrR family transcriptional regulator